MNQNINGAPQGSVAWHKMRANRVTGSTAGNILGLSEWTTAEEYFNKVVYDHVYGSVPFEPNDPMKFGIKMEAHVIELSRPDVIGFNDDLVYMEDGFKLHPDIDWMGVSPDQLIVDKRTGDIVSGLEVKTQYHRSNKQPHDWIGTLWDQKPSYWVQCQLSMQCYETSDWHFFVSHIGNWTAHEVIQRDDAWFRSVLPIFREWRERVIEAQTSLIEQSGLPADYRERMAAVKKDKPVIKLTKQQ